MSAAQWTELVSQRETSCDATLEALLDGIAIDSTEPRKRRAAH